METALLITAYLVKLYRILSLWMIVYVLERVYLERFITRVYIEDKSPKGLAAFVVLCAFIELISFLVLFLVLFGAMIKYKTSFNSFIIDRPLLIGVAVDYFVSTLLIINTGAIVASVIQNRDLFNYHHDGLRGIRANAVLVLYLSLLLFAIPFYRLL